MCELFAVSSQHRVSLTYSLNEFARHGGLSHLNKSGWGMSFQQNSDTLLIKEAKPAFDSPWVRFVAEQETSSHCILAHVRYATTGDAVYEDTHPFKREAWGTAHVFAHNGDLHRFHDALSLTNSHFQPLGQTDSEHAFCYLMEQLVPVWQKGMPSLEERLQKIGATADCLRTLGSSNFIYSDGDALFIHADLRRYDDTGVFGPRRSPALHYIERRNLHVDGLKLRPSENRESRTLIFASVPLTDDDWQPLPRGSLLAIKGGGIAARLDLGPGDWQE